MGRGAEGAVWKRSVIRIHPLPSPLPPAGEGVEPGGAWRRLLSAPATRLAKLWSYGCLNRAVRAAPLTAHAVVQAQLDLLTGRPVA